MPDRSWRVIVFVPLLLVVNDALVSAQQPVVVPAVMDTRVAAHRTDFDYLLGDWEFTGHNSDGEFHGRWSARKLSETGQIFDEFRILGPSGETYFVSSTLRSYNAVDDRWDLVSVEHRAMGLRNIGTGHRTLDTVYVLQAFGAGTSLSWTSRIRYYDIKPDRFSWVSDRSLDGGKTWILNYQRIEAHRTGPARSMAPLTLEERKK